MNASREDIEKFDAYLQGAMNSEEKMLFESALATNDSFRQEFELHEQITAAIAAERETHFRKILAEQRVNTFIGNNTWSKKFTLASAAVMLIGMLALFVSYLKNP